MKCALLFARTIHRGKVGDVVLVGNAQIIGNDSVVVSRKSLEKIPTVRLGKGVKYEFYIVLNEEKPFMTKLRTSLLSELVKTYAQGKERVSESTYIAKVKSFHCIEGLKTDTTFPIEYTVRENTQTENDGLGDNVSAERRAKNDVLVVLLDSPLPDETFNAWRVEVSSELKSDIVFKGYHGKAQLDDMRAFLNMSFDVLKLALSMCDTHSSSFLSTKIHFLSLQYTELLSVNSVFRSIQEKHGGKERNEEMQPEEEETSLLETKEKLANLFLTHYYILEEAIVHLRAMLVEDTVVYIAGKAVLAEDKEWAANYHINPSKFKDKVLETMYGPDYEEVKNPAFILMDVPLCSGFYGGMIAAEEDGKKNTSLGMAVSSTPGFLNVFTPFSIPENQYLLSMPANRLIAGANSSL